MQDLLRELIHAAVWPDNSTCAYYNALALGVPNDASAPIGQGDCRVDDSTPANGDHSCRECS